MYQSNVIARSNCLTLYSQVSSLPAVTLTLSGEFASDKSKEENRGGADFVHAYNRRMTLGVGWKIPML